MSIDLDYGMTWIEEAEEAEGFAETQAHTLTADSLALFKKFALDASNWGGTPLVGGNFRLTAADKGNLTDLKKHGLVTTYVDEGCTWLEFTEKGNEFAASIGLIRA